MANKLKERERTMTGSAAASGAEQEPLLSEANGIDVTAAVDCSTVSSLFGRPFPVQFRKQGALDAWTRALGETELWRHWQDPGVPYRHIRSQIAQVVEMIYPTSRIRKDQIEPAAEARQILEMAIGTNLKFHLNKGPVIEATPALETLLTNSDVDLSLPMSMVAPPYRTQFLRFGEAAMRYLKVPGPNGADCVFEGVFCFFSPCVAHCGTGKTCWMFELIFIIKGADSHRGHLELSGTTDRDGTTLGMWLDKGLRGRAESDDGGQQLTLTAVSYVVRVFLYMTLKQSRVIEQPAYDEALGRAAGLGERKRAKLLQRSASLYNSILVGPESLSVSAGAGGTGSSVAPHWRRGHFRMQPFGAANQQRKLIFVAPVLIHADQLQGEVPAPKSYRAGAAAVTVP